MKGRNLLWKSYGNLSTLVDIVLDVLLHKTIVLEYKSINEVVAINFLDIVVAHYSTKKKIKKIHDMDAVVIE